MQAGEVLDVLDRDPLAPLGGGGGVIAQSRQQRAAIDHLSHEQGAAVGELRRSVEP